ncbi:MAG: hypothetical protein Q9221_006016 [Calogaya cf. arnoldii]
MSTNVAPQNKGPSEQCLQQCAGIHRKALATWYYKITRSLSITKEGRSEMQNLVEHSRAQEELAALKPTNREMSEAQQWLYVTTDGQYAKHRPIKQPFFYKVLARDGVSTLPPQSSPDNNFSNEAEPQPQKAAKFPRRRLKRGGADFRSKPYARPSEPGKRAKKNLRHPKRKDMKGSDADSIREASPASTATRSAATNEGASPEPPEPIKFPDLAIRVVDRGLSGVESEGNASNLMGYNDGSNEGTMPNAATNQEASAELPKPIDFTNLAIRVIDRGLTGVGSGGNASNLTGYNEGSHDDTMRSAATNQGASPEPLRHIEFTNLAIRVIDRGLSGAGSEGNASSSMGYNKGSHDDVL